MTLGFIAAFIGIFVGLVVLAVATLWFIGKYGDQVLLIIAILGVLLVLGYAAWEIAGALVSKG